MSQEQKISGLYRIMTNAKFYTAFQNFLGAETARQTYFRDWVKTSPQSDVLDIGCGPGVMIPHIQYRSYIGIDLNAPHVNLARSQNFHNAKFYVGAAQTVLPTLGGDFDAIFSIGFLHHLNDESVRELMHQIGHRLRPGGAAYFLEPVFLAQQRFLARKLKVNDSGQHIRNPMGYEALLSIHGCHLETRISHDLLRVPYDHFWGRLQR